LLIVRTRDHFRLDILGFLLHGFYHKTFIHNAYFNTQNLNEWNKDRETETYLVISKGVSIDLGWLKLGPDPTVHNSTSHECKFLRWRSRSHFL